jgi:hypothetical protein
MSQKLMIVLLVVVVVLFIVTVVIGASHGSWNGKPDGVSALQGLQGNRFLAFGDHSSATCASPGQTSFTVSFSCTITLDKRSFFSKSTRVAFIPQQNVSVVTDPKSGPTQTVSVDAGKCFATAVDHSGGTITVTGGPGTQVVLGPIKNSWPLPDCPQKPGEG